MTLKPSNTAIAALLALLPASAIAQREPAESGQFQPTWESLAAYETPEWFRDAKFGIWAHWGPQCQPEAGDWYARAMYEEGGYAYKRHIELYGHPSQFGFMDVINEWKAENWDPENSLRSTSASAPSTFSPWATTTTIWTYGTASTSAGTR